MSKKSSGDRSPRADSAAKQKPRKSPKAKTRKPTPRQSNLIDGIIDGKSVRAAALQAGYSEHTAAHPDELLNTQAVRIALANLIAPIEKLAQRINEGLDAEKTEFAKFEGRISDKVNCVDFEQRRQYVQLAGRFKGLLGFASDVPLQGMQPRRVLVEYVRADQMTTA